MPPEAVIAGLLTLLGGTWSALIAGFFRGDLIPGHVYRREVKRGDTATTQAERNASTIAAQDVSIKEALEILRQLKPLLAKLRPPKPDVPHG